MGGPALTVSPVRLSRGLVFLLSLVALSMFVRSGSNHCQLSSTFGGENADVKGRVEVSEADVTIGARLKVGKTVQDSHHYIPGEDWRERLSCLLMVQPSTSSSA